MFNSFRFNSTKVNGTAVVSAPVAATAVALSLSPSSGVVGDSFSAVATLNGTYTGSITYTPGGTAGSGLSPVARSVSGASSVASATFVPATDGTLTVAVSANPSLTADPTRSATVAEVPQTVSRMIVVYFGTAYTSPDSLSLDLYDADGNHVGPFDLTNATEFPDGSGNFVFDDIDGLSRDTDYRIGATAVKGALTAYDTSILRADTGVIQGLRTYVPSPRNVQSVDAPTFDDCLIAAFVESTGDESKPASTWTKKLPNGDTFVTLYLDDPSNPTLRSKEAQ